MRKLVIGCGPGWPDQKRKYAEQGVDAVSIDIIPEFDPDICADITKTGLGVAGANFDEIEAYHVLEHIQLNEDFKQIMWQIYLTLKPGGTVDIAVPHKDSPAAYQCFEHTRFFIEDSFMNFYENPYAKEMNLPLFEKVINELRPKDGGQEVHVILRRPLV